MGRIRLRGCTRSWSEAVKATVQDRARVSQDPWEEADSRDLWGWRGLEEAADPAMSFPQRVTSGRVPLPSPTPGLCSGRWHVPGCISSHTCRVWAVSAALRVVASPLGLGEERV